MSVMHLTTDLQAQAERFGAQFHAARMEALAAVPGNPFEVALRYWENGVAVRVRHPLLRGKNRILGVTQVNLGNLEDLLHFYRSAALPFSVSVPAGQMTYELFRRLTEAGLWSRGSGTVPACLPGIPSEYSTPPEIQIRRSPDEEKEAYLDLFQEAFAHREERDPQYRIFQWAEDGLPGGVRYIAEIDGKLVGMASFPVVAGVGFLGTAGVLPEYRGRGVQMALIRRRLQDALTFGCTLVLAGGSPGTTTYRNFERAGFHLIPTGTTWAPH